MLLTFKSFCGQFKLMPRYLSSCQRPISQLPLTSHLLAQQQHTRELFQIPSPDSSRTSLASPTCTARRKLQPHVTRCIGLTSHAILHLHRSLHEVELGRGRSMAMDVAAPPQCRSQRFKVFLWSLSPVSEGTLSLSLVPNRLRTGLSRFRKFIHTPDEGYLPGTR